MPVLESLSASETAGLAADAPILVGANALELTEDERWSSVGSFVGGVTDEQAPAALARDGRGAPSTAPFPDGTAEPESWSLMWALPVNNRGVDLVGVFNTNLASIVSSVGGTIEVRLETADNSTFTIGTTVLRLWTLTTAAPGIDRLVGLLTQRARGQRWFRLRFTIPSGTWPVTPSLVPSVGEVWLGHRRQMPFRPQRPVDFEATDGAEDVVTSGGGLQVGAVDFRERGVFDLRWRLRQDASGVEARDVMRAWWRDTRGGGRGLLLPRPSSEPGRAVIVRPSARGLSLPEVGFALAEGSVRLFEQPPFWALQYEAGVGE